MICKLKKHIKRITFFCLSLTLLGLTLRTEALANDIDESKRCDFKIEIDEDGSPLSGVTFNLYHVADVNADGTFSKIDSRFSSYKIDPDFKNTDDWDRFAYTLDMSIIRDGIPCDATRSTGSDGTLLFENLPTGLYMVSGLEYRHGNHMHEIKPFMVSLPTLVDGQWEYNIISHPKFPGEVEEQEKVNYNVIFLWDDEGVEDKRPKSVEIALLKIDNPSSYTASIPFINKCYAFEKNSYNEYGKVVDTATVSDKTGWRYTFEGLDYGCEYDIVTEELKDYYLTASYDKRTFIFRHRASNSDNKPVDPDGSGQGDDSTGGNPDKDNGGSNNGSDLSENNEKLPQTGQLWWPVPFMILAGLILCIFGIIRRRGDDNEK